MVLRLETSYMASWRQTDLCFYAEVDHLAVVVDAFSACMPDLPAAKHGAQQPPGTDFTKLRFGRKKLRINFRFHKFLTS
jgi:hypothetical protein